MSMQPPYHASNLRIEICKKISAILVEMIAYRINEVDRQLA